jgi:hypothetical protein
VLEGGFVLPNSLAEWSSILPPSAGGLAQLRDIMLVFVDESGDCGIKGRKGTSEFFFMTAILFNENDAAEACDLRISTIREELHMRPAAEFHFNKCRDDYRCRFLNGVSGMDFFYVSFILNKAKLYGPGFAYKESFYKYAARILFENCKPHLKMATITIDRSGDREFTNALQRYLKRMINTDQEVIKKVKSEHSHSNNLLQLADMVCGAVARSFAREKKDSRKYRKIIGHRELSVQVWPKV